MSNRRDFLKGSALLGAAAMFPMHAVSAWGNGQTPETPEDPDTYTVDMRPIRPRLPARKIEIPDVEGLKVLKGDFHMHTLLSDGYVMPRDRIVEAVDNDMDVISITDHIEYRPFFSEKGRWPLKDEQANNFNLWYDLAKPEAEKRNLLLVRGAEITKSTMPPGHFNALFTEDNNPIAAAVDDWRKMLQVAADQGAFLLWNHPGWQSPKSGGIEPKAPLRFTPEHEEACKKGWMHGIEIFNGSEHYPIVSDWCNQRDLAIFADSDIHDSEFNTYGHQNPLRPITLVLAKGKTVESVREACFARRTIGWAAGCLWGRDPWLPALFKAAVQIKTVTPGVLELVNTSSLPCTVQAGGFIVDLPKDTPRQIFRSAGLKTLTVTNWMVATGKPLEIPVA